MLQVRYEAERAREQAQKQLAAAEGRAGVLHTRLDDVLADNRALKHKVSILTTRRRNTVSICADMMR
jgi:hypothetical protein